MATNYTVSRRSQALQSIADKSTSTRYALQGVHFNEHCAVATDGRMLIVAPKAEGEPDNVTIRFGKPKQAGRLPRAVYTAIQEGNATVSLNGDTAEVLEGRFPKFEDIFPKSVDGYVTIGVNAAHLFALAKLISPENNYVALHFKPDGKNEPILIGYRGEIAGVAMPVFSHGEAMPTPAQTLAKLTGKPAE